jgi:hypothetical protein
MQKLKTELENVTAKLDSEQREKQNLGIKL